MKRFKMTKDHIKLLRNMNVTWYRIEFGAPSIDGKRPYGNGDMYYDLAEMLGIKKKVIDGEADYTQAAYARMDKLHKETEDALQIVLRTGRMKVGTYACDDYDYNWRLLK